MRGVLVFFTLVALAEEGHTSTYGEWTKAVPGMCIGVEIQTGNSGDAARENALVRDSMAELDKVSAKITAPLQARLKRYKSALLSSETAPCDKDDGKWSAPIVVDTVRALTGTTPMGVSSWRGVTVKLRLSKQVDDVVKMKTAADFAIAQFRGNAPVPDVDDSITLDIVKGWDYDDPPFRLFAALAVVAKHRPKATGAPIFDALAAVLDDKPLPPSAAKLPPQMLIALWSPREQIASWMPRLDDEGWFVDERKADVLARYLGKLPPVPNAKWRGRQRDDDLLHDLVKVRVAVEGEDQMIEEVWNAWRARTEYDDWKTVIRVLLQLTFAQRKIAVADKLFVATARLDPPPVGYKRADLVRAVLDQMWRMKQPLSDATVRAVVDEAVKVGVAPAAISAIEAISWSLKDRDALLAKLRKVK